MAMHVHIQVSIFSLGQLFSGERCEHASGTLGLFTVVVVGVFTGGSAGKNHGESPESSLMNGDQRFGMIGSNT
jgi:hypothetical protein